MSRKLFILAAIAATCTLFVGTTEADAGWRRNRCCNNRFQNNNFGYLGCGNQGYAWNNNGNWNGNCNRNGNCNNWNNNGNCQQVSYVTQPINTACCVQQPNTVSGLQTTSSTTVTPVIVPAPQPQADLASAPVPIR